MTRSTQCHLHANCHWTTLTLIALVLGAKALLLGQYYTILEYTQLCRSILAVADYHNGDSAFTLLKGGQSEWCLQQGQSSGRSQ
eukprot:c10498_g1_i1 orf=249-500(-)